MRTPRRAVLLGGVAGLLSQSALPGARAQGAAKGEPIRIGCITALSGPQEVLGRPILNGAQIAADQVNADGGVMGRKLLIVEGDAHADPDRAVQIARDMHAQGINLLCGCVTSDLALAVSATLESLNAVLITCSAQTDKLTHEAFTPHCFRVTDQVYMRNRAQALLMAKRYPDVKRWGAILPESEYGRSSWAAFRDGLLEGYPGAAASGIQIDSPVMAAFGAENFHSQIKTLKARGADGLFIAVYGDDGVFFYEQAREAGLFDSVNVIADSFNEFLVPLAFGSSLPENLWLAMTWYYAGYQNLELGRRLYRDYMRATGIALPSGLVSAGHAAVLAYAHGIGAAGSTEPAKIISAMQGMTFDTAKGKVTFRAEDHQAICDVNFVRLKTSKEALMLDITDTSRPDVEVAEFVRYDGASVIEPPSPGKPLVHRA